MSERAVLQKEIDALPTEYVGEVIDFVEYLKHKKLKQVQVEFAEQTLRQKVEVFLSEDEAWKAMAADTEREREAQEWCNGYFGPKSDLFQTMISIPLKLP